MPASSEEFYQNVSMRKAILLVRYVNFMKQFLHDMQENKTEPTVGSGGIPIPAVEHKDKEVI